MKIIKTKGIDSILPIKINVSKTRWKETQIELFSLGCRWSYSGRSIVESYEPYLFIDKHKHIRCSSDKNLFDEHAYKEIPEYKLL